MKDIFVFDGAWKRAFASRLFANVESVNPGGVFAGVLRNTGPGV